MDLKLGLNNLVITYLIDNPPTLGHAYGHLWKVAKKCEEVARGHNFDPMLAWATGMLHDIYRPAKGGGQEEHETTAAMIARGLLAKTELVEKTEEIVEVIENHDEKILEGKGNTLMEILSLADKSEMSFQRAVAYSWACGGTYGSFVETIRDFSAYQVKAWRVFLKSEIDVKGGVEAYLQTNQELIGAVRGEIEGKINYKMRSIELAKKEAEEEVRILKANKVELGKIKTICANFWELI